MILLDFSKGLTLSLILIKLYNLKPFVFTSDNSFTKFSKFISWILFPFTFSKYWLINSKIASILSFSLQLGKSIAIFVEENQFQDLFSTLNFVFVSKLY